MCFYWVHPKAAEIGDVGEILACSPTFFTCVFDLLYHQPGMVWRSLWPGAMAQWCGHGALTIADDGTQQFGHLFLLAGAFDSKDQGSCLF